MNLLLFLFSVFFVLIVLKKKKIFFNNIFPYMFLAFIILYVGTCYLAILFRISERYPIKLLKDYIVLDYLNYASLALIVFGNCFLWEWNDDSPAIPDFSNNPNLITYKIFYIILYPIALYLSSIISWTNDERVGLLPSLAAYSRNFITVLTIYFFSQRKISKRSKVFLLFFYLILTIKSTQRTNLFIVAISYIYTIKDSKKAFKLGFVAVFLLLFIGSFRNGISIFNLIYPIFGEGLFGSWGSLNAIDHIQSKGYQLNNIFYGFNEILNFFFEIFGFTLPTVSDCITHRGIDYYPMGGFFYLSDAILFHPVFGVIIYTIIIYFCFILFYRKYKRTGSAGSLLGLGLLFELIKASLKTVTAMYLFHFLFLLFLYIIDDIILYACKSSNIKFSRNCYEKRDIDNFK